MDESPGRVILVINGRVVETGYRARGSTSPTGAEGWRAVSLFGGTLLPLGILAGLNEGGAAAIAGVVLFLIAGVAAGAERYPLAAAVGCSAIVWAATGISLALGVDTWPIGTLTGAVVAGLVFAFLGLLRARSLGRTGR
jgi:hypothetical protein